MLARAYRTYPTATPLPGASLQNGEDWWKALAETVREVSAALPSGQEVLALAMSVQGGTLIPADRDFCPIGPGIVWNDTRAGAAQQAFARQFPEELLYEKTGWPAGPGQPLMQLYRLRQEEPEVFEKAAWFLTVHDFLSARLTGKPAVDLSDGGINQLVEIRQGRYDPALLAFAGVEERRLAALIPSGQVIGPLTEEAARALGLTTQTLLVSGAHDQYAAALGAGTGPGEVMVGSGTSWVLTCLDQKPHFELGLPQSRAAEEGLWGSIASITTGGICLEWFRTHLTPGWTEEPMTYAQLDQYAAQVSPGANGLRFYPYLSGAPLPLGNPEAAGTLTGLRLSHNSWDMTRAILEGVVFQLAWLLRQLRTAFPVTALRLSGGAVRSSLWTSILADVTGLPVSVPAMADLPCVGAAILAGAGAGCFSLAEGRRRMQVQEGLVEPDQGRSARYQVLLEEYIAGAPHVDALYRTKGNEGGERV